MKLTRLYSNTPSVFSPMMFNDGLSVVLAEIRMPANRALDTHNLGKTTVGELIDFMLLKGKRSSFFLFKHESLFSEYVFFLEIRLDDGSYLTVGRPVNPGSKVWFVKTEQSVDDASALPIQAWAHVNIAFDRAKLLLDGYLNVDSIRPWDYRKLVGYLVRSQADYTDVFQLGKFSGKHQEWKPFVAHLLGMSSGGVTALYDKREELAKAESHLESTVKELGGLAADLSVLDGLIAVKRREAQSKSVILESFNFDGEDRQLTQYVVEELEASISGLNEQSYQLTQLVQRLGQSLEDEQILFSPRASVELFAEAGILFPEQLSKSYEQLVLFNRAITDERKELLEAQLTSASGELETVNRTLAQLNARRATSMEFLRESESLVKYRELSRELITVQSELNTLEVRRGSAARVQELRQHQRGLTDEFGQLETKVEEELNAISQDDHSRFGLLRGYFSDIIHEVLDENAILAIKINGSGGVDFTAEFVSAQGTATSGDRGTSYKKLLCIAFDLSMLRTYSDANFPRFVYHDGALEQLEPRKRKNLIRVLRQYADLGLQPIISALDSDLPHPLDSDEDTLSSTDVIALLHDEGDEGRLFKMPAW